MSKALLEKLRRSREIQVQADGHTFTVRRPTEKDLSELDGKTVTMAQKFVVGWDLKEVDVIPGGGPEAVPFDADLWADWVADRSDLWLPLATAMYESYSKHVEARQGTAKN